MNISKARKVEAQLITNLSFKNQVSECAAMRWKCGRKMWPGFRHGKLCTTRQGHGSSISNQDMSNYLTRRFSSTPEQQS